MVRAREIPTGEPVSGTRLGVVGMLLIGLACGFAAVTAATPERRSESPGTAVVVICRDGSLSIDGEPIDCRWLAGGLESWLRRRRELESVVVVASPDANAQNVAAVYSLLRRTASKMSAESLRDVDVGVLLLRDLARLQLVTSITPWLADERFCSAAPRESPPPSRSDCTGSEGRDLVDPGSGRGWGDQRMGRRIAVRFIDSGRITDEAGRSSVIRGGLPGYAVSTEPGGREKIFGTLEDAVAEVAGLMAAGHGKGVAVECGEEDRWDWVDLFVEALLSEGFREIVLFGSVDPIDRGVELDFPPSLPKPPAIPGGYLGVKRNKVPDGWNPWRNRCVDR